MSISKIFIAFIAVGVILFACEKEIKKVQQNGNVQTATVNVHLTDAPGLYKEVNVDVQRVEIFSDQTGWISVDSANAGVYNLLDFTNGADTLLGSAELPAGRITQMRLILGDQNTLVDTLNNVFDLTTPSGQQSGIKLNIQQNIESGLTYDIWIDFNAEKSIVKRGNGAYNLKPVIRAYTNYTSGAIKGIALPDSADSYVFVVQGTDTFATIADNTGYYLIGGVPANTYDVHFTNANGYRDTTINGIVVTTGNVTDMDTTTMSK